MTEIIKIWQIEITKYLLQRKKPKTVYFWQNSKSDGKESDRRGKNDEIDKKQSVGKNIRRKEQQLGLYPGLSVSCDDICGRFAMKGVYPFGENSALVVDGVHSVYSLL